MATPRPGPPVSATRTVCMSAHGAQSLDVIGPLEIFAPTSRRAQDDGDRAAPRYELELLRIDDAPIRLASGLRILPDLACRPIPTRS